MATMNEDDQRSEIVRLEARIDELEATMESCRKFILAGRIAVASGTVSSGTVTSDASAGDATSGGPVEAAPAGTADAADTGSAPSDAHNPATSGDNGPDSGSTAE